MRMRVNRWLLNVDLRIYWILSSFTNFKCKWRIHIQEIELLLNTSMSPGEFLVTIITKPFFLTFLHLCFIQMLKKSGFGGIWVLWETIGLNGTRVDLERC